MPPLGGGRLAEFERLLTPSPPEFVDVPDAAVVTRPVPLGRRTIPPPFWLCRLPLAAREAFAEAGPPLFWLPFCAPKIVENF